jgi:hypothetical protein
LPERFDLKTKTPVSRPGFFCGPVLDCQRERRFIQAEAEGRYINVS